MENCDYLDIFNRVTCGEQRRWEELLLQCKEPNSSPLALATMVLCHFINNLALSVRLDKDQMETAARSCYAWLEESSQIHCPSIQFFIAAFFEIGIVVEGNKTRAFEWYQKSALGGCVTAQCCLGVCYQEGRGVARDLVKAMEWLQRAVDANYPRAQCVLAECMLTESIGDKSEAIRLAMLGAEAGYSYGWYVIAQSCLPIFNEGKGDIAEARKWLEIAVNHNCLDAMCELGRILVKENGDISSNSRGLQLYQQAIELGSKAAVNFLGRAYESGYGVETNYVEALRLYKQAANSGSEDGCYNVAEAYYHGRGVEVDYIEAADWFQRAVDADDLLATVKYGKMWSKGRGRPKNLFEAVKWYRIAAQRGNLRAQQYLGECYFDGEGVEMDKTEALRLIRGAADRGYTASKEWLKSMRVYELSLS